MATQPPPDPNQGPVHPYQGDPNQKQQPTPALVRAWRNVVKFAKKVVGK